MTLELPPALRSALKDPLGPIAADPVAALKTAADSEVSEMSVVAVGDVVTSDLLAAGHTPAVAVVDGRTERAAVSNRVADRLAAGDFSTELTAANPPGTITAELAAAIRTALVDEPALIRVDGEEDLAALPAILAAPAAAVVLYGQPGEGVVAVAVDEGTRDRVRGLLSRMDGDPDPVLAALGEPRP
ncbi:DUF359 domain-containing protein [Halobacteriales archaeon QH_10_67_13]|nr:MAG: DUF359 domain-containing protein [Halobacteriales archaeon QH_10_67_13]